MVTFTHDFVERMRRMEFYRRADEQALKSSIEVVVVKGDNLLAEASTPGGDVTWFPDEHRAQGGSGKGVSPLAYFLSSLGLCQMAHYAEHAATKGIELASLSIRVRGRFSLAHPRRFEEIAYRGT